MAKWESTKTGHNCTECGSYTSGGVACMEGMQKDCLKPGCRPLGNCECGEPLADGGPVGVYCTAGWKCPTVRKMVQSIRWFLRPLGVSRVSDNDKVLMVSFNRVPTDDELREIHEKLKK
jgi:hypothetical protein